MPRKQRLARERLRSKPGSLYGILRYRRGRPKGETKPVEKRRGKIELDFLWLQAGGVLNTGWTDLRIAELLLNDDLRKKHKLGKCQYRQLHKETLRRYITAARNKF